MESLVPDLINQPVEGIDNYLNKLRSKSDLIAGAATYDVNQSTALLEVLKEISVSRCIAGFALFLSFQTEALNESAYLSFLTVANLFFGGAAKDSLHFVPEEGVYAKDHIF